MDYVEITRHFRDLATEPSNPMGRRMLRGLRDPLTWSEVLAAPEAHIVLVAASGLGKSTELQQQARRLRRDGRYAVLVSARELVAETRWNDALDLNELAAFEAWQASEERAVIFVDGVDELVLVGREFNSLVRRLAQLVGQDSVRYQLVLSARGGWSPKYAAAIRAGVLGQEDADCLREVTFEALDQEAIRRLAIDSGCEGIDGFMRAYGEHEIEATVDVRPMDIPLLVQRWNRLKALGTWSEILDGYLNAALSQGVTPRDFARELTTEAGRTGAERVGAATLFLKTPFASLPAVVPVPATIALRDLFADWAWRPLVELTETALFLQKGPAIQLQQGTLPVFLAARWLTERWRRGRSSEWLREQLMVRVYGEQEYVIPPSRRATAGWVASFVPEFRSHLREYPELVLYEGDPDNLHDDEIIDWLGALVGRTRFAGRVSPTIGTLRKLARPGVEGAVVDLLNNASSPTELELLLNWATAGRYEAALDRAIQLALDSSQTAGVRSTAVRVVAACEDQASREALKAIAGDPEPSVRTELLPVLVPHVLRADELVEFIMNAGDDHFSWVLRDVATRIPDGELDELLKRLLASGGSRIIDAQTNEHFDVALPLLAQRLRRPGPYPDTVRDWVLAIEASSEVPDRHVPLELGQELDSAIDRRQDLRRRIWLARLGGDDSLASYHARFGHRNVEDVAWLVELASSRPELSGPALAAAQHIFGSLDQETREKLTNADETTEPVAKFLNDHQGRLAELNARREEHDEQRRSEAEEQRTENIAALQAHRDTIAKADNIPLLERGWEMVRTSGADRTLNTERLQAVVGSALTDDFLRGFKALWRKQAVELPHPDSTSILIRNLAALGGIGLEVADGLDFTSLTPALAERATKYALYEMNGLPEWFPELVNAHPIVALDTLRAAATLEWSAKSSALSVLRYAPYSDGSVASVLRAVSLELLTGPMPTNAHALHSAVDSALLSADGLQQVLVATRKAVAMLDDSDPRLVEWIRAWAHLAPDEAAEWFVARVKTDRSQARALLVEVAALLERDFDRLGVHPAATRLMSPDALERWISLLVAQVRPEHDEDLNGFVAPQHHAQDFRQRCLRQLATDTSPLARTVLQRLTQREPLKSYADWGERLLAGQHQRAAEAAATLWKEQDVLAVERGDERRPRSLQELFVLVRRHLMDVGRVLIDDEFSYRDLVPDHTKERELQLWVASTLRQRARGLYSVVRENVVDDDKEVDITAAAPGVGQVPIEIKPAASYSARQLEETIRDQLIGRYMTQHDRTMGVLLLIVHKPKRWTLSGKRRGFRDLCEHLREHARLLGAARNKVVSVEAIDIESSRPRKAKKKAAKKKAAKKKAATKK